LIINDKLIIWFFRPDALQNETTWSGKLEQTQVKKNQEDFDCLVFGFCLVVAPCSNYIGGWECGCWYPPSPRV